MIDLSRTRTELLREIEATGLASDPLTDITDTRIANTDAHVRICGHGREDLFPALKLALSERLAAVPRPQLARDLLMPLRNALGNASKHGNRGEPPKKVSVELVLTGEGVLIAVSDEGAGFDVPLTFRRFLEQESYFANRGTGFRNFHGGRSTVSYENGGRTLLLSYRPPISGNVSCDSRTCPALELAEMESCRVYTTDDYGTRYVVRVSGHDGQPAKTRILTGRLHATVAGAKADCDAATRLYDAKIAKDVLIPRPLARVASEPRLVLYEFDPWMNFWEYQTYRHSYGGSFRGLRHSAKSIGRALAGLHRSEFIPRAREPEIVGQRLGEMTLRAETHLQSLPCTPTLLNHFRFSSQQVRQQALERRRPTTPIHGAFRWDCIHYGSDDRLYLYRFEGCRRSDPGFDLGGFAADVLCFALANHDQAAGHRCCDVFLSHYNAHAEHAIGDGAFRFYTALILAERLGDPAYRARIDARQWAAVLGPLLCCEGQSASTEVRQ